MRLARILLHMRSLHKWRKPELANLLQRVEYTVGECHSAHDEEIETPPGFGYLSPGIEADLFLAASSQSNLSRAHPSQPTVLRAFVGGQRAAEQLELDDESLVKVVTDELEFVLERSFHVLNMSKCCGGLRASRFINLEPRDSGKNRDLVGGLPGLHLGNWIGGASVAECITRANTSYQDNLVNKANRPCQNRTYEHRYEAKMR